MRVAVIGATGRTGVPLVGELLARDHVVTALVRDQAKAGSLPMGLTLVFGGASDSSAMARLVEGAEAVVDLVGPSKQQPVIREAVTRTLLDALGSETRRVVMVTGAGVRVRGDEPRLADRLIVTLLRRIQPEVLADGERAVELLSATPHRWTVVRVPRLVADRPGKQVRVVPHVGGQSGTMIGRQALASTLPTILEGSEWVGRYPVVSWQPGRSAARS